MLSFFCRDTNQYLTLKAGQKVDYEKINPLFQEKVGASSAIKSTIALPFCKENIGALGLPVPDSPQQKKSAKIDVVYMGLVLGSGLASVLKSRPEKRMFEAAFVERFFDLEALDVPLVDVDFGGDKVVVGTAPGQYAEMRDFAYSLLDNNCDTADFVFTPVSNEKFYEGNDIQKGLTVVNGQGNTVDADKGYYYSSVMNRWDYELGEFWKGATYNHLYADLNANRPGWSADYQAFHGDVANGIPCFSDSCFVPFPYLISVLRYVARHLGNYTLAGDWVQDADIRRICLFNTHALDRLEEYQYQINLMGNLAWIPAYKNTHSKPINLKNHVPDVSIGEFLEAIAKKFNLSIRWDENTKEMIIEKKASSASGEEIRAEVEREGLHIEVKQDRDMGVIFSLDTIGEGEDSSFDGMREKPLVYENWSFDFTANMLNPPGKWGFWRGGGYDVYGTLAGGGKRYYWSESPKLQVGAGKTQVDIKAGTLRVSINGDLAWGQHPPLAAWQNYTWNTGVIPTCNVRGNSEVYFAEEEPKKWDKVLMLFYRGLHQNPNGSGLYPIATNNMYDENGGIIAGANASLKWVGTQGLYEKWHKSGLQALDMGREFSGTLLMSISDFASFDFKKWIRIDNHLYAAKSLKASFGEKGYSGKVKAVLYQKRV